MASIAPAVSICVPIHNGERFVRETIESALAQTFRDFELVLCDNASNDGTHAICNSFLDERIRYVRYENLVPQSGNWNRCLTLARGEFVILLHADDLLHPEFLTRALAVLRQHDDVGLVNCAVQRIDVNGRPLVVQQLFDTDRIDRSREILRKLLLDGCVINPAGVLVRKSVLERVGPFTDAVVWGIDWHMWIRIASVSPVAYLADPLASYRQHESSGTAAILPTARNARDECWVVRNVIASIGPEMRRLERVAFRAVAHRTWCLAEDACRGGMMKAARAGIKNAVRIDPSKLVDPRVWALWIATYMGYGSFQRLRSVRRVFTTSPRDRRENAA